VTGWTIQYIPVERLCLVERSQPPSKEHLNSFCAVDIAVDGTLESRLELMRTCERRGGGWGAVGGEALEQPEVSEDERESAPVPFTVTLFGSHQLRDEPHKRAHATTFFAIKEGSAAHLTATHRSELPRKYRS
jgi:hypothetical protein